MGWGLLDKIGDGFRYAGNKVKDGITAAWNGTKNVANKVVESGIVQKAAHGAMKVADFALNHADVIAGAGTAIASGLAGGGVNIPAAMAGWKTGYAGGQLVKNLYQGNFSKAGKNLSKAMDSPEVRGALGTAGISDEQIDKYGGYAKKGLKYAEIYRGGGSKALKNKIIRKMTPKEQRMPKIVNTSEAIYNKPTRVHETPPARSTVVHSTPVVVHSTPAVVRAAPTPRKRAYVSYESSY
jgi:hypothetical protein